MALFRNLTISTTTFERMKEKLYGFRQTVHKVCAVQAEAHLKYRLKDAELEFPSARTAHPQLETTI